MTNRQYLTKLLDGLDISEGDIDVILLKSGMNGNEFADVQSCDIAVYKRMSVVLKGAMQNVSQGGYSVSWNIEAVKLFYAALCEELGVENTLVRQPKVRNRSDFW